MNKLEPANQHGIILFLDVPIMTSLTGRLEMRCSGESDGESPTVHHAHTCPSFVYVNDATSH